MHDAVYQLLFGISQVVDDVLHSTGKDARGLKVVMQY